jgi:hypothetical protein
LNPFVADGEVWACGSNNNNKLGLNSNVKKIILPQPIHQVFMSEQYKSKTSQLEWNVACGYFHAIFYQTYKDPVKSSFPLVADVYDARGFVDLLIVTLSIVDY